MTYTSVYIGELASGPDKFDFGGTWSGNIPPRLSPEFPPLSGSMRPFSDIRDRILDGRLTGKQVDYGGFVASADGRLIKNIVEELHANDEIYTPNSSMPWLLEKYKELTAFLDTIDETKEYALVAEEW